MHATVPWLVQARDGHPERVTTLDHVVGDVIRRPLGPVNFNLLASGQRQEVEHDGGLFMFQSEMRKQRTQDGHGATVLDHPAVPHLMMLGLRLVGVSRSAECRIQQVGDDRMNFRQAESGRIVDAWRSELTDLFIRTTDRNVAVGVNGSSEIRQCGLFHEPHYTTGATAMV